MRWGRAPASPSSTARSCAPARARGRPRLRAVGRRQAHAVGARCVAASLPRTPSPSPPSTSPTRACEDAFRPVLVSYDNTVDGGEPATYIVEHGRLRDALLAAAAGRPSITLLGGEPAVGLPGRRARGQRRSRARACAAHAARGAARCRRRAGLAAARGGRHRRRALELSADRHRHHGPARAAAPGPRRAALPARPARSPSCR